MTRVVVDRASFRRYRENTERAIRVAVDDTADQVAAAARATSTEYDIREVLDSIESTPARPSRRGYAALVLVRDWRGRFFESGTYAKRGARKSNRGRASAVEGNRGVKPVKMLRKQVRPARAMLEAQIRRRLR